MYVVIRISLEMSKDFDEHILETTLDLHQDIPADQRTMRLEKLFEAARERVSKAFGETTVKAGA